MNKFFSKSTLIKKISQKNISKIFLYGSLLLSFLFDSCGPKEEKKTERKTNVEIGEVIAKTSPIYIYAVGNTLAPFAIDVRSQVTGVLLKSHVIQGQYVEKEQLIYTIDPAPYEANLMQVEAQLKEDEAHLKLAEDKVERFTSLAKEDFISQLQFDEYNTNVALYKAKIEMDKAQILEAKINLDYCYIRSPIKGKLSYNFLDLGNLVTANSSLLTTIRQMDPMKVNFNISQRDFVRWQTEREGEEELFEFILLDSNGNKIVKKGQVTFVDNNISTETGTILFKGFIHNEDNFLWPGEFGEVRLILKMVENATLVPVEALQIGETYPYVFILKEDDTVEERKIQVIETLDNYMLVNEGFTPGEKVITNGQLNLRPGMKVNVQKPHVTDKAKENSHEMKGAA